MTTSHRDTDLRLRDDIASGARRLGDPTSMGVPAVIMGADATRVSPGSPTRIRTQAVSADRRRA